MTDPMHGWSAADVHSSELVTDAWIAANTQPGKKPSKVRLAATGLRKKLIGGHGLSRDQMRRICVRAGIPYKEAWSGWNRGAMTGVWGALCHHTGTPWTAVGDYPTLKVVRDGRSDLQNSLCAFGLGRYEFAYLISEKLSWHAGAGNINGLTDGNGKLVGIEAESDGAHWTPWQVVNYPKLVASILVEIDQDDRYTTRHATYALPAGRKTDFSGWPGGTDPFWADVYRWVAIFKGGGSPFPIIGAIRARYDQSWVGPRLGVPLGPEVPTADGVGRWQAFAGGAIYWHPSVGANPLWGLFYDYFKAHNYEFSLGYPVSGEFTSEATHWTTQGFQHGKLELRPEGVVWTPQP